MTDEFLIKLSPKLLAEMANQPLIRKYLNKYLLITLLRVHPTLPSVIAIEDTLEFIHYLLDPWFRTRLPCSTISTLSANVELVKKIPGHILETIMTSKRMLSCIPIRNSDVNFACVKGTVYSLFVRYYWGEGGKFSIIIFRMQLK